MSVSNEDGIKNNDDRQSRIDEKLWIQDKYILEAIEKRKSRSKRMAISGTTAIYNDNQLMRNKYSNTNSTNSPMANEIDGAATTSTRNDVDWWRSKIRRESFSTAKATEPTTDTDTATCESWGNHRLHEDTVSVQTTLSEVTTGSHGTMSSKQRKLVGHRLTVLIPDVICLKKTKRRGGFRFFRGKNLWSKAKGMK